MNYCKIFLVNGFIKDIQSYTRVMLVKVVVICNIKYEHNSKS